MCLSGESSSIWFCYFIADYGVVVYCVNAVKTDIEQRGTLASCLKQYNISKTLFASSDERMRQQMQLETSHGLVRDTRMLLSDFERHEQQIRRTNSAYSIKVKGGKKVISATPATPHPPLKGKGGFKKKNTTTATATSSKGRGRSGASSSSSSKARSAIEQELEDDEAEAADLFGLSTDDSEDDNDDEEEKKHQGKHTTRALHSPPPKLKQRNSKRKAVADPLGRPQITISDMFKRAKKDVIACTTTASPQSGSTEKEDTTAAAEAAAAAAAAVAAKAAARAERDQETRAFLNAARALKKGGGGGGGGGGGVSLPSSSSSSSSSSKKREAV